MPKKKYIVSLTCEERQELEQLTKTGKAPVYKVNHARILLKADINQAKGGWTDRQIGESLDMGHATIERVRQRFVEEGMEAALCRRKQQKRRSKIIDGEKEAYQIAIACSKTPTGKSHWTLKMLADKMVELNYVEQVSTETIRQTLKKMNLSLGSMNLG